MPVIDANKHLEDGDWTGFDVTIVGAGAAGIMLAILLGRRGKRVLIIESGHFKLDPDRQSLNRLEQSGKQMTDVIWNHKRAIGGTTLEWGGQSLPFSPCDFGKRDWIDHSGWPVAYETLSSYYTLANRFMGIDELNYDNDILALLGLEAPGVDAKLLRYHFSKWAKQPNFAKLHRADLERHATVLYNAHLLRIDLDDNSRVKTIEVGDFRARRRTIPVGTLVLAAGGIETNRILLHNDHQHEGGLGNASDWLGKAFMEHPCLDIGHVESDDMARLQQFFGSRLRRGSRYSVRLSTTAGWQAQHRLLAASASLMWIYDDGSGGPLTELGSFVRRPRLDNAFKIARGGGEIAQGLWALARTGLIYKPGASARVSLMCEQEPSRDSYVALSNDRDRFGMRSARLHWRISPKTWETVVAFSQTLAAEMQRSGLGHLRLLDHVRADAADHDVHLSDVNHHMGGARMSASPDGGVVDDQLRLWGVPNLRVCSAAVFPTGSHSNPTLTLLALAARLADDLTAA